jgi:hypothetical protein
MLSRIQLHVNTPFLFTVNLEDVDNIVLTVVEQDVIGIWVLNFEPQTPIPTINDDVMSSFIHNQTSKANYSRYTNRESV